MKKEISIIVFWGAIWGLVEATLGYILHIINLGFFNISGLIMFPIGFYFMNRAYKECNKISVIFYVSIIAAFIKLTNLIIPGMIVMKVVNPATAILLEGICVLGIYKLFEKNNNYFKYILPILVSLGWRGAYALLIKLSIISGTITYFNFIVLEGVINSVFIFTLLEVPENRLKVIKTFKYPLGVSFSILALAVVIQWIL